MQGKLKVLVVDDESDICVALEEGLKLHGYDVTYFTNPNQALDAFKRDHYDHVITDIRMPEMSGFEMAHKLWNVNQSLAICFLSAFDINPTEAKAVLPSLNNHCFLTKPVAPGTLAEHIKTHVVKH